jgi:hypothetical protein
MISMLAETGTTKEPRKKPGERHGQEKSTQETPKNVDAGSRKETQTQSTRSH